MPFGSSPPPPGSLPSAMSSSVLALSCLRGKWHHRQVWDGNRFSVFFAVLGFGINKMTLVMITVLGITKRTVGGTGWVGHYEYLCLLSGKV
ncbi:hypothetical protein LOK49_LG14G01670 [Camellia lanceoleosa]|uniref:Uncharacterized protein n=1 Tax=Camellia lanceoleosa TaxID=1840588 RepID=A0ACC0FBX9_9ERIC|nr:hypothetical protein LOK49_LG14G01670 [Camellia lanceoleosa]